MEREKLSMIGHVKDTPRVLKKAYEQRHEAIISKKFSFLDRELRIMYR